MFERSRIRLFLYAFLSLTAILIVAPLILTVFTAFRPTDQLNNIPWSPPFPPTLQNFITAWTEGRFGIYFKNSLIISTLDAVFMVLIAVPASYVFAFLPFRGQQAVLSLFIIGLVVPPVSIILPLFISIRDIGLYNSRFGVVLADIALALPIFIFILHSFMRSIPHQLRESALMDGTNEFQLLTRIIAPIAKPVIVTTFLLEFIWSWNDLLLRLVLLTRDELRTLTVGLLFFQGTLTRNVHGSTAAAVIMAIPVIILFFIFKREFITGLTSGSVKA